jgi:hypothetical protein
MHWMQCIEFNAYDKMLRVQCIEYYRSNIYRSYVAILQFLLYILHFIILLFLYVIALSFVEINVNPSKFYRGQAGARSGVQTAKYVTFLPSKAGAVWKFWPEGAILSWNRRLKDSMAPEGQNFHIAPNLGRRKDILSFLLLS